MKDTCLLTVGKQAIEVVRGTLLRDVCDDHWLDVPFNCREGACGTCAVEILQGSEHLPPINDKEEIMLSDFRPGRYLRLACQITIHGPVTLVAADPD